MTEPARQHLKRQPLNLAAGDLRACLDYSNADELRDVIDQLRDDMNRQFRAMNENADLIARNIHNPRAVHPDVARRELHRTKSLLRLLLQLYMATTTSNPEKPQ